MFPSTSTCVDELSFVHDGPAITSAGGEPSPIDAALYLTEVLYGRKKRREGDRGRGLVHRLAAGRRWST